MNNTSMSSNTYEKTWFWYCMALSVVGSALGFVSTLIHMISYPNILSGYVLIFYLGVAGWGVKNILDKEFLLDEDQLTKRCAAWLVLGGLGVVAGVIAMFVHEGGSAYLVTSLSYAVIGVVMFAVYKYVKVFRPYKLAGQPQAYSFA